ncbi:hypothetical protein [Deinococcus cavernae]|uniref:hypothetical protein n=1 Tax=Deinococcus cavernae TaxID=2320857 RepID=UPI001F1F4183|nr:hypothetical protein [Deinococcus cavernae]
MRAHNRVLSRDLKAANQHKADLRRTLEQAQTLEGITELTDLPLSSEEMTLSAAALLSDAIASDLTGLLVFEGNTLRVQAAHSHPRLSQAQRQVFDRLPRAPQGVLGAVRGKCAADVSERLRPATRAPCRRCWPPGSNRWLTCRWAPGRA